MSNFMPQDPILRNGFNAVSNFMPQDQIWRNGFNAGLQVRRNMKQIGGGLSSGSSLAVENGGIIATYDSEMKDSEVSEMVFERLGKVAPQMGGLQYVCTEEAYYAFLNDFFWKAGFKCNTGYFTLTNSDNNQFGIFGAEVIFKSGIKLYTGIIDNSQSYIGSLIAQCGYLWADNTATYIYATNGNLIYDRNSHIPSNGAKQVVDQERPDDSYYVTVVTKILSTGCNGYKTLHGLDGWQRTGDMVFADATLFTGIFIDNIHQGFYMPDGTQASFSNDTIVAPCSNTETEAYCHLNAIINPNFLSDIAKYNVYKTFFSNGEEVTDALIPIISLGNRSMMFVLVDIVNNKFYQCLKILNNSFVVICEIESYEIPNINEVVASFIATEGG